MGQRDGPNQGTGLPARPAVDVTRGSTPGEPRARAIHLLRAAAVVLNTLVFAPLVVVVSLLDEDAKVAYRFAQAWVRLNLWISGVRLTVRGLENLDRSRHYVFMSNHRSNADIIAIASALSEFQLRWVAKKELLRVPVFGWGLKALKNIIIDRSNRDEAVRSYRLARERMQRGISVIVYPEGTRGVGSELLPFKKGGFLLAIETGTPIVPVAINGTAAVLAKNGWRVEKGDVEVVIGRPIETAHLGVADRNRLIEDVRQAISSMMRSVEAPLPAAASVPSRA